MADLPREFLEFTRQFHQDVVVVYKNVEELIVEYLSKISDEERQALCSFLEAELVGHYHSRSAIAESWNNSNTELSIDTDSLLGLYEKVLEISKFSRIHGT